MRDDPTSRYSARVFWSRSDAAFVATCPEFEGISALGASAEEALHELGVVVGLAVETYEEAGWDLPAPFEEPEHSGQFRVRLPRSLHGWLVWEAQREGVSLNTLIIARLAEARGGSQQAAAGTSPGDLPEDLEPTIGQRTDDVRTSRRPGSRPRARKAARG